MEKFVLVIYCEPSEWPKGFLVEATPHENAMVRGIDNVNESVARTTPSMKQDHNTILHFLGKSTHYKNEEEFDRKMKKWREDEFWDQDELGLLSWSNYGKWDQLDNMALDGDCNGAWHFYHVHAKR